MSAFLNYLGGVITSPGRSFERLFCDQHKLQHAAVTVLLLVIAYIGLVTGFQMGSFQMGSFFAILLAASVGVAWGVAAVVMHGLGRIFGGAGTFRGALAAVGFAAPIPTFLIWVCNSIMTDIIFAHVADRRAVYSTFMSLPWYCFIPFIILTIWSFCLFCIASLRLHQVPLWKGTIIALFSFFAWWILISFLP